MDASTELEIRGTLSALFVALTKGRQFEAARALWDWAEEWIELGDELEELIEEELDDA